MNAVAPPNSPPADTPWKSRAPKIPSGAQMPTVAYPGMTTINAVPNVISRMDALNAARRPRRSA